MADTNKKRPPLEKIITPKGTAKFPYLTTPDTKFKATGTYVVEVVVKKADCEQLLAKLEKLTDEAFKDAQEQLKAKMTEGSGADKAKAKKALADLKRQSPIKPVYDDEGNESDDLIGLKFSMDAQFTDKKSGATRTMTPDLVDAKGNKHPANVPIYSGSQIKVGGKVAPFFVKDGAGVKLRLEAVKVLQLVTAGGGGASAYGFDDEEEGYVAEAQDAATETSVGDPAADSSAPEEDPDF